MTDEEMVERFKSWRDINELCRGCGGSGNKTYGNTSTWKHRVGGQSITQDVCDECWGSGDATKPYRNLKELFHRIAQLETALDE